MKNDADIRNISSDQEREYLPRSAVGKIVPFYGTVENGQKVLLSRAVKGMIHIASLHGLPICRNQGRTNLVFEKIFMGTLDEITCGHCKRYAASEHFDRFHRVLLEGDDDARP